MKKVPHIVHVAVASAGDVDTIVVVDQDGKVWAMFRGGGNDPKWTLLPPLPRKEYDE